MSTWQMLLECFAGIPSQWCMGMIKRPNGDARDSEVSYHLIPSRGGANAGDQYANAIPASTHYNNLEKFIWSTPMKNVLANHNFTMVVRGYSGPLDQVYRGKRDIDDATRALLDKRLALIEAVEPRAYTGCKIQKHSQCTSHQQPL